MVERNCLPNHGRVGAEPALPQTVANDRHRVSTRVLIFRRQERAASDRIDTQQLKVVAGHRLTPNLLDSFRSAELELLNAIRSEAGKNFRLIAENQKVR